MIKGRFTVSSGRMVGDFKERTFEYQVVQWIKDDEYTKTNQKIRKLIQPENLQEAETIYVKVTGGEWDDEYRYLWGPFRDQKQIEELLTDIYLYGSP